MTYDGKEFSDYYRYIHFLTSTENIRFIIIYILGGLNTVLFRYVIFVFLRAVIDKKANLKNIIFQTWLCVIFICNHFLLTEINTKIH